MPTIENVVVYEGASISISPIVEDQITVTWDGGIVTVADVDLLDTSFADWRPIDDGWTGDWMSMSGLTTDTVNSEGFYRKFHAHHVTYFTPHNDSFGEIFAAIVVSYLERKG
jgi:hypothetical protein